MGDQRGIEERATDQRGESQAKPQVHTCLCGELPLKHWASQGHRLHRAPRPQWDVAASCFLLQRDAQQSHAGMSTRGLDYFLFSFFFHKKINNLAATCAWWRVRTALPSPQSRPTTLSRSLSLPPSCSLLVCLVAPDRWGTSRLEPEQVQLNSQCLSFSGFYPKQFTMRLQAQLTWSNLGLSALLKGTMAVTLPGGI